MDQDRQLTKYENFMVDRWSPTNHRCAYEDWICPDLAWRDKP